MSKDWSAKYYENNKERLPKKACESHHSLSKQEQGKKWQYGFKRYKNLQEDKKERFVEYRKNY